jgi:hypothetical protein
LCRASLASPRSARLVLLLVVLGPGCADVRRALVTEISRGRGWVQIFKRPIRKALERQQDDSAPMRQLLGMGYRRPDAQRALLEAAAANGPRTGAAAADDDTRAAVQAAVEWLMDEEEEEEEEEGVCAEPVADAVLLPPLPSGAVGHSAAGPEPELPAAEAAAAAAAEVQEEAVAGAGAGGDSVSAMLVRAGLPQHIWSIAQAGFDDVEIIRLHLPEVLRAVPICIFHDKNRSSD